MLTLIIQVENQFLVLPVLPGQDVFPLTHRRVNSLSTMFLEAGDYLVQDPLSDFHLMWSEVPHSFRRLQHHFTPSLLLTHRQLFQLLFQLQQLLDLPIDLLEKVRSG